MTADQKVTLYGVARAALRKCRDEGSVSSVEAESVAIQEALDWAMGILEIPLHPALTSLITEDVVSNGGDVPEARLDKFLAHTRALEAEAEASKSTIEIQDNLLDKLEERIAALVGSSITNDNGVQVTVVVPKRLWDSIQGLMESEAEG